MPGENLVQEKTDTKENLSQTAGDQNFNKLETALKTKIPTDEEKYNKFLGIFQNIKDQKSFTEDEICTFITSTNINLLNRQISKPEADANKIVLENMDMFLGKTIDANTTKNEIKENIENKKTEEVKIGTEKVKTGTEKVKTGTEAIKTKTEKIEKKDRIEARTATKDSYNQLDPKYQINDEQLQKEKATIPQNIINQVTEKTKGTDLKADDYLKFYLTAKNNKDELKDTDFMKNYEKLNEELFPTRSTFTELKDPNYTDLIVENNESVKNFAEKSDRLDKIKAPTLPEAKDFESEFAMYVKFIPDEKIRKNIENNKDLINTFKKEYEKNQEDTREIKGKEAYDEYTQAIDEIKENLPKRTEMIIRKKVPSICVAGLARYFDSTTIGTDKFTDNSDLNTQDGFKIQKGTQQNETNDDILYINGNIKGNSVGFYYNLNNPDAQLQSDDFLHFDGKSESFAFGIDGGGKNDLGVKLPTIGMLSAQAQGVSEREFSTLMEKSENWEDLESSLKNKVSNELLKNYGQEALVKTRVERDVEKNITTQTLHNTFFPEAVMAELNRDTSIDKTTERKARKLLKIRDKTTENMRSDELKRLGSLTERLDPLIKQKADNTQTNLEPKRQGLLKDMEKERTATSYTDQRGSKTLTFFRKFSKNDQINLDDLEYFITGLEKKEPLADNMSKFSPDFQTTEEHEDADKLLEKIE